MLASRIIQKGNLMKEPKAQAWSREASCANMQVDTLDGQQIVLFRGVTSAPLKRGLFNPARRYSDATYTLKVSTSPDSKALHLSSSIEDPEDNFDFIALSYDSPVDEKIYGLGL
jgi:hypothetical protein